MTREGANPLAGTRLAFIGAGVMAESMIAGILKQGQAGPDQIVASHPRPKRRDALTAVRKCSDFMDLRYLLWFAPAFLRTGLRPL